MKECWINVYPMNILGRPHPSKLKAIAYAYIEGPMLPYSDYIKFASPPIGRLHVKLKEQKPKYKYEFRSEKQWDNLFKPNTKGLYPL